MNEEKNGSVGVINANGLKAVLIRSYAAGMEDVKTIDDGYGYGSGDGSGDG